MLYLLHILKTNPDPSRPTQMPSSLAREILYHDTGEHDELRVDAVEDAVVGEVEAVGDFYRQPA